MQDLGIISPGLDEFRELAGHSRVIPVRLKVLADAETPIGLYRKLAQGQPGTFLLESAAVGGAWSRYSFIGARSRATLTTKDGQAHWLGQPPVGVPLDGSPVDAIRDTVKALHTERFDGLPPFTSGLVGFLGWETVRHWEKLTSPPEDDLDLPEMALNLVTDMAVHDNMDGTVLLIANAINFDNSSERVDEAWHDAVARVKALLAKISTPTEQPVSVLQPAALDFASSVQERWDENDYLAALDRGKEAIVDGEVFQVVISRRFEMDCGADPLDVYRVLRNTNPSPYMYIFSLEDAGGRQYSIVGSSPEALVTVTGEEVITHPIAGSRPRGKTIEADKALAELAGIELDRQPGLGGGAEDGQRQRGDDQHQGGLPGPARNGRAGALDGAGGVGHGCSVPASGTVSAVMFRSDCAVCTARIGAAALLTVSSASVALTESATMPPPACT